MTYKLWVNSERTVMVRLWDNGTCEVAFRVTPAHSWGPPIRCAKEVVAAPIGPPTERVG